MIEEIREQQDKRVAWWRKTKSVVLKITGIINPVDVDVEWAIGIYASSSSAPLNFSGENINNPVLTANNVSDVPANFVADPFLVHDNGAWFMFFEVINDTTRPGPKLRYPNKGAIGLAVSNDGLDWSYRQIVLDEPFHLSYPYVFQWKGEYYMIPETYQTCSVRLYKADSFPYTWSFVETLISGKPFVDSSILRYGNIWYIFTATTRNATLRLYYAKELTGPWTEHPESPIIEGDAHIARPAGRITIFDGRIIRFAQDDDLTYGKQVWAFEITKLTPEVYEEHIADKSPILKGTGSGWNADCMHHICPCQVNNKWIASVDGGRQVPRRWKY